MTETPIADRPSPLLLARGVTKTFDRTRALAGADFELREREIHGLLGANGAGKSTLSKVISGHHMFDAGEMTYRGHSINLRSTRDALRVGIAIVMQETSLVPDLTVLENIFLPQLGRPGRLDYPGLRKQGLEILTSLGQADAVPLDWEVRRLSSAQKQLVEIAKALGLRAKLVIFDEPTASLSPSEVDRLFDIMSRLRTSGCGLVFVSHRLEEVFSITDRVTVMREGRTVMNARATTSLNQAELIRTMVGAELGGIYTRQHPSRSARRRLSSSTSGTCRRRRPCGTSPSRCTRVRSWGSAGSSGPGDPRRSKPCSGCVLGPAGPSPWRASHSGRIGRRRRSAPAWASWRRTAARRTSSRT